MTDKRITHRCCSAFEAAQQGATDNEGYEPLVFIDSDDGLIHLGSDLPPIGFCPWCGVTIQAPDVPLHP